MPTLDINAKTRIYIGSQLADKDVDFVASDFDSQTWLRINGATNLSSIGDSFQLVTSDQIGVGRTKKGKGTANAGSQGLVFDLNSDDPGQLALIAAGQVRSDYAFKIEWDDAPVSVAKPATMTIAAPGVVTSTAHGWPVGQKVRFATTGDLPTGLVAGTEYFVKTTPSADTLTVSATNGGTAITTTGSQSGTHTVQAVSSPTHRMFIALVMGTPEQYEGANDPKKLNAPLEINSNIVRVAAAP